MISETSEQKLVVHLEAKKKLAAEEKVAQTPGKPICVAKRIPSIMERHCLWHRGLSLIFEIVDE